MDKKIDDIRTATSSAAEPAFTDYNNEVHFDNFESVGVKLCSLDQHQMWFEKDCVF